MLIYIPDNIQECENYLEHKFSKIEALCDYEILKIRQIELSVRRLALRWGLPQTTVFRYLKEFGTLLEHSWNDLIYVNQQLNGNAGTILEHFWNDTFHGQEKEKYPPNNIYNNPLNKEKEYPPNYIYNIPPEKTPLLFPRDEVQQLKPPPKKKFVPPTIAEIEAYAKEKGVTEWVDAEKFWNFYDSKNWYVGKNKMVRWRSAVANWAKTQKERNNEDRTTHKQTEAEKREQWLAGRLLRKYKDQMAGYVADGAGLTK